MLINNARVLAKVPGFLKGLLEGILVKNIKSFKGFTLRIWFGDLADFIKIVLVIFVGLGVGLFHTLN